MKGYRWKFQYLVFSIFGILQPLKFFNIVSELRTLHFILDIIVDFNRLIDISYVCQSDNTSKSCNSVLRLYASQKPRFNSYSNPQRKQSGLTGSLRRTLWA